MDFRKILFANVMVLVTAVPTLAEQAHQLAKAPERKVLSLVAEGNKATVAGQPRTKSVSDDLIALQVENAQLKEELNRRTAEIKAIQSAFASANSRAKVAEEERQKLEGEVKALKGYTDGEPWVPLIDVDVKSLMAVVDEAGQSVWLNGVGEAHLATTGDLTVMKFPLADAVRTDRALAGRGASRLVRGQFVYYSIPSKYLAY